MYKDKSNKKVKRIMVDMSVSILHNGHIRILKKAKKLGYVIVALTTDKQIKKHKGYHSELNFNQRKEILDSIKYIDKIVPSKWLIDEKFLDLHKIDLLVHGNDNPNKISQKRLRIYKKTKNISANKIRRKIYKNFSTS